jgi:purine-binding chemotaxis protein CheW
LNGGDQAAPASAGANTQRNEVSYLVFRLADDEFGLPIDAVVEVADVPTQLTRLPKAPDFIEGVINLRGDVLPVVDQRRRFDMPPLDERAKRRLIVVRTEQHRAGLVVDGISGVLRIPADTIEPAPDLTDDTARLVKGVANLEKSGRMVLLLDPAELLTRAERGLLDAFHAQAVQANA